MIELTNERTTISVTHPPGRSVFTSFTLDA